MASIEPDAYPHAPYAHVVNQCGHVTLGLAIASLAAFCGLWWPIPLAAAAVYWVVGEYVLQRAGLFWDGLEDAGFVAAGASFPFTVTGSWAQIGLVAAVGAVLGIGAWRRYG